MWEYLLLNLDHVIIELSFAYNFHVIITIFRTLLLLLNNFIFLKWVENIIIILNVIVGCIYVYRKMSYSAYCFNQTVL